jgi:hypothetical protein
MTNASSFSSGATPKACIICIALGLSYNRAPVSLNTAPTQAFSIFDYDLVKPANLLSSSLQIEE